MIKNIQTFCQEIGESACYALSIIHIAELVTGKYYNILELLNAGIMRKYIRYNANDPNDDNNFFVDYPAEFLSMIIARPVSMKKVDGEIYYPRKNEYVIDRWERKRTGCTTGHFRMADWDSLFDSQTVKYGKIVSHRVFTVGE